MTIFKNTKKISLLSAFIIFTAVLTFSAALSNKVSAADDGDVNNIFWGNKQGDFDNAVSLKKDKDPREVAGQIINIALGFLGIIAVIIILYGGFLWMTSMGNDEKVTKAKEMIIAGVIGLVIILSAYAISQFVLRNLLTATNN